MIQFFRFCLVGVFNTLVGLLLMYLLYFVGLNYWLTTFIGNLVGVLISFLLNKHFTFRHRGEFRKTMGPFILVSLICYFSAYFPVYFIFKEIAFLKPHLDFSFLIGAGAYTLINFITQKFIVFQLKT
jgi:putative flippase GtrA